ncbi:hypothetical protein KY084_08625 [Stakelama sp. CBK3Z-3]|uniref:Secreted protein n=1 Tax=Stakelama flava TaxID=2860338 RepID=A0ABS6XL51_9SPHN|nr:hypothetical protein [Stakelama flava]MBW4330939.1 hypothetical protein [Stakelama flava]
MNVRKIAAAATGWAAISGLALASSANAAAPCFTKGEAQSVASVVAPSAVRALRTQCVPKLARSSYMNQSGDRLVAKLDAAARGQLPDAMKGIARLVGSSAGQIDLSALPPEMILPLIDPLVAAKMGAQNIDGGECRRIDQALSLIDPLPARNISGLLVLILQFDLDKRASDKQTAGGNPLFTICEGPEK